jgi:hypothetical protein
VVSSAGSAIAPLNWTKASLSFSINFGAMPSCTRMRDPATQTWLLPSRNPWELCCTALARLASLKMIEGDLPPSSRLTCLRLLLAAAICTRRPEEAEPVKEILAISICDASRAPTLPPPEIRLTTPGGKPASLNSFPRNSVPSGDFSEDLKYRCCQWLRQVQSVTSP